MAKRRGNQISLTSRTAGGTRAVPPAFEAPPAAPPAAQEEEKLRATIYFSPGMAERLDEALPQLKRLTGLRGHAVSRSAVVEAALIVALDDMEQREERSGLVNLLLNRS